MTKSIVCGIVALALVLGCDITEVIVLSDGYGNLHQQCLGAMEKAEAHTLTEKEFVVFRKNWEKLREASELLLPHSDVYELNLRFAEAQIYARQQNYPQLSAHLSVIEELLRYVPHLMVPSPVHVL